MDLERQVTLELGATVVGTHLLYVLLVDPALESIDPSLALSDAETSFYTAFGRFGTLPVGGTDFSQPAIYVYLATVFAAVGLYVALRREALASLSERYAVADELET